MNYDADGCIATVSREVPELLKALRALKSGNAEPSVVLDLSSKIAFAIEEIRNAATAEMWKTAFSKLESAGLTAILEKISEMFKLLFSPAVPTEARQLRPSEYLKCHLYTCFTNP